MLEEEKSKYVIQVLVSSFKVYDLFIRVEQSKLLNWQFHKMGTILFSDVPNISKYL